MVMKERASLLIVLALTATLSAQAMTKSSSGDTTSASKKTPGVELAQTLSTITGVAISNVVPPIQQALEWMCDRYFGVNPLTVEPGVTADLPLNVDTPREVGADRVVSCVAAVALYGTPLIVVDFGTATRFDCVNRRGEFIGGAIAPGINTAAEALVSRAARLFRVELVRPKDAIGRNTITNIQSGMIYGWAGLVDGIVERMRREMEGDVKVVGTGGLVGQMREVVQCLQFVNPELKLEGLRMLWERANPVTPG